MKTKEESNAEKYRESLPKRKGGTGWTTESYSTYVSLLYPHITVPINQEWKVVMSKLTHICEKHGSYEAPPHALLKENTGCQCQGCFNDELAARKLEVTLSFIGQVTPDGHTILEHIGYHQSPSQKKKGRKGAALYLYKCGVCGDETSISLGNDLKKKGEITGCPKCSSGRRESISTYMRHPEKGQKPCCLYVSNVYYGDYIKVGITNNYDRRSAQGNTNNLLYDSKLTPKQHYLAGNEDLSYEDLWFKSKDYPRSWIYAIEQIIHRATLAYVPKKPLPQIMIECMWSGQSELRDDTLDPQLVKKLFHILLKEIKSNDGDWVTVYNKHINQQTTITHTGITQQIEL